MKHTPLRLATAALALLIPVSGFATGVLSANDSIAGLGMTATLQSMSAAGDVKLTVTNPAGKQSVIPVQTDSQGSAKVTVSGKSTQVAGTYTLTVSDTTGLLASASVAVLPETMDTKVSTLQSWTPRIRADNSDEADIRVTLRDKYGNLLPGRPVALVSSRSEDRITALTPETGKDGVQHFSLTTSEDGAIHIRAVDLLSGNTLASSVNIQAGDDRAMGGEATTIASSYDENTGRRFYAQVGAATFDLVDAFDVVAPLTLPIGEEAQKITIRAIDKNGETVENYVGTVNFESTDKNATLPNFGTYTFKERDLGQKSFPLVLKFKTPGEQMFRVVDKSDPAIMGVATISVGSDGMHSANGITITSHKDGDTVGTTAITIAGTGPAYANLTVMGGVQDAFGSTNADGSFSIPVTLSAAQRDFTIRVQDDTKLNDSGPMHLILDATPPTIGTISFSPSAPVANDKVLVVVESEPNLSQIMLKIQDTQTMTNISVPLTVNPTSSGSYQAFFDAPAGGTYQPAISATDRAGNTNEVRTMFVVGMPSLPTVENVIAEPRVNAVALQWDPLTLPLDGYRVYVGESPTNFLYTLDTGRVTTKATVAGLTPGKMYYFAVTALKGMIESKDKSAIVQAAPLGLTLDVTPADSSLHIRWTSLSSDLPLSEFQLEYGTKEDAYTETRTLNGALRDYVIRDLINGIPYFIRLTPVTVTGDTLEELAAKGQGIPNGSGFHAGPNDPVPDNLNTPPDGGTPPRVTDVGVPTAAWIIFAGLGVLAALYGWRRQHALRHAEAFLQSIQSQYKH